MLPLQAPFKVARHEYSLSIAEHPSLSGNIARANKEYIGNIGDNQQDTDESIDPKSATLQSYVTWPHAHLDIKQSFQLTVATVINLWKDKLARSPTRNRKRSYHFAQIWRLLSMTLLSISDHTSLRIPWELFRSISSWLLALSWSSSGIRNFWPKSRETPFQESTESVETFCLVSSLTPVTKVSP